METQIALLRGVNVGGHRKIPMAELRGLAKKLGLIDAQTHLASGNLIFKTDQDSTETTTLLESGIHETFGFPVDVIVLTAAQLSSAHRQNPFPAESEEAPQSVMLCFGAVPGTDEQLDTLRQRASDGEKVERVDENFWFFYAHGAGRSKLGFRATEGVWTSRNWRTVEALLAKAQL